MGEGRGTPSYNVPPAMQSPRYGGCVSAFFHLFDWTSAKRLSSAKRLAASKSEKGSLRISRSFRTDHGKTRLRQEAQLQIQAAEDASTRRAPGVIARLMGLDSLPEAPDRRHRGRLQSCSRAPPLELRPDECYRDIATPVQLQDLLQQDLQEPDSKTKSLRQRLPALFTSKRKPHGRQFEARFTRRSSRLAAFRCRSEEWCLSPAYFDIPQARSRFLHAMTQKQKDTGSQAQLPFRSRLGSTSSIHGEEIPELSLRASSTGREILLQGWPLATQHNVPRDLYHAEGESGSDREPQASESVGSRPTDSASSRPFLTNANSAMVQGKRRGSSWNGSDDSESTIEKPVAAKPARRAPPPRHRIVSHEIEFKATRRGSGSRNSAREAARTSASAKREFDRQPLMENSRTTVSHKSVSTGSQSSITSDLRSVSSKPPRERVPDHAKSVNSAAKGSVRSPAMAPGNWKPPGAKKVRQPKGTGSSSLDSHGDGSQDGKHHLVKASRIGNNNGRKEAHSSPKLQRFTEKVAAGGVPTSTQKGIHKPKIEEQAHGDRLENGRPNAEAMASHSTSNVDNPDSEAVLRSERTKRDAQHARARSVDDLIPELPLRAEPRELFSQSSPDIEFSEGRDGAGDQISMSPLIDYDELCYSGEFGKDGEGTLSSSPLIDCDFELRGLRGFNVHANPVAEVAESGSVESYQELVQEVLELRWEDEIVETILSGRCCERSCSGPSISSRSVTFSDAERNEDSWSSCASHNPGDCDSCSDALSGSPRTNLEVKVADVEPDALQAEPSSPPMQFLQKPSLDESVIVDDAAGQPSPVSILQSPFHDEACTTSESSPESTRQCCSDPPASKCHTDKLKQALLDLSSFQTQQKSATSTALFPQHPPHPRDDHHFISQVLAAANFLSPASSAWHAQHTPMDPSLFEKLESEGKALTSGGLWRWDRKLMFDCVNEAFGASWAWGESLGAAEAWLRGRALVAAVESRVSEWKRMRGRGVDDLVERDMGAELGCRSAGRHVVEVGVEVEGLLWEGMLEEVVVDLSGGDSARPNSITC